MPSLKHLIIVKEELTILAALPSADNFSDKNSSYIFTLLWNILP